MGTDFNFESTVNSKPHALKPNRAEGSFVKQEPSTPGFLSAELSTQAHL